MTDTDPRLEAELPRSGQNIWADAIRKVGFWRFPEPAILELGREIIRAINDVLRAFDQGQPTADRERIIRDIQREAVRQELNAQPQPESEVMPHSAQQSSRLDNATAPVMGADPPWLEEGYCVFRDAAKGPTKGARIYAGLRAFAAFVNAQPPSEAEIDAVAKTTLCRRTGHDDSWQIASDRQREYWREDGKRALIAAYKVRSRA